MKRALAFAAGTLLLAALWRGLAGQPGKAEVGFGLVGVALAVVASVVVRGQLEEPIRLDPRLARELPRLPWALVRDGAKVLAALVRRGFGARLGDSRLRREPLPATDEEWDAKSAAVATGITLTPNVVAVDVLREERALLYHELTPQEVPPLLKEAQR